MNALADNYAGLSKEKPDSAHRAEYISFHDRVVEITGSLGRRDTPAYLAHGAGVVISLAIQHLYPAYYSRARFEETRAKFKAPYDVWLNPANPQSIVAIISSTKKEVDDRVAALNARPRKVEYRTSPSDECVDTTTVIISGDLTNGFSGKATTNRSCRQERPCPRCICCMINELATSERNVKGKLLGMLGVAVPLDVNDIPIPQFTPSGIAVVDEMNHERIAIFEAMNRLARQQVMQDQMEKMRDALAAPLR